MEGIIKVKEMTEKVMLTVWIFPISKRNLELLLKVMSIIMANCNRKKVLEIKSLQMPVI
mgnify:CR=1 FL=1